MPNEMSDKWLLMSDCSWLPGEKRQDGIKQLKTEQRDLYVDTRREYNEFLY